MDWPRLILKTSVFAGKELAKRRVVVTGLGIVSPVGSTVSSAWQTIVSGKSGIGLITRMDTSLFTTQIGGPVRDFDIDDFIDKKDARKMDPFIHYGIAAAEQALTDSGVEVTDDNRHRIGVAIGAGIGGLETIEASHSKYIETGKPRKISPFFIPCSIINMVAGHVSIRNKLTGPNFSLVTACTTATHCIGFGMRAIQYGDADVMIAGGCEMAATVLGLGGFCSARALSTRNDDPERASRPWDAERDGFVLSDGAGCVVLEELEYAQKRGANILAELIGFGMSADAYHMTAPLASGEGASLCM